MTPETTEKAVVVQTHQLQQATRRMWELDRQLAGVESTRQDNRKHLKALDADMAQMFEALGLKRDAADVEMVLRACILLRHYSEQGEVIPAGGFASQIPLDAPVCPRRGGCGKPGQDQSVPGQPPGHQLRPVAGAVPLSGAESQILVA